MTIGGSRGRNDHQQDVQSRRRESIEDHDAKLISEFVISSISSSSSLSSSKVLAEIVTNQDDSTVLLESNVLSSVRSYQPSLPPSLESPSLDFDRLINEYSTQAVKKRLVRKDRFRRHHEKDRKSRLSVSTLPGYGSIMDKSVDRTSQSKHLNGVVLHAEEQEDLLHLPNVKVYMRWFLTILTGLCCGLVAVVLVSSVAGIVNFRSKRVNHQLGFASGSLAVEEINDKNEMSGFDELLINMLTQVFFVHEKSYYWFVFIEYNCYNLVLALLSSALCLWFAPTAVGSGIPEVKAYLNGVVVESFADLRVFVAKIVGTILSVSSGLVVGPEGPLVHIGALIGQGLTKTTIVEILLRSFQRSHPTLAAMLGCAPVDMLDLRFLTRRSKLLENSGMDAKTAEALVSSNRDYDTDKNEIDELGSNIRRESDVGTNNIRRLFRRPSFRPVGWTKTFLGPILFLGKRGESRNAPIVNTGSQASSRALGSLETVRAPSSCEEQQDSCSDGAFDSFPTKKTCGSSIFSQVIGLMSRFRNDADRRDLISIGVATGFAAAFGAPVGGLLYSIEEASSYFTIQLMWRTLAATALATVVIAIYHGELSQYSVLSLGGNGEDAGLVFPRFSEIPFYILTGVVGGILGALFNEVYAFKTSLKQRLFEQYGMNDEARSAFKFIEVAIVSTITSTCTFLISTMLPETYRCTAVDDSSVREFSKEYGCPTGTFNELGSIMLGSRDEALNRILKDPSAFDPLTLFVCGMCFYFLMLITFGIAIPSGLFMPSLLSGASLGGFGGLVFKRYCLSSIDPSHFALLGATAILAGIQRTTFSLCVIMMEATAEMNVLMPLMIAVIVARYVADFFNKGFYHIDMEMKNYPYLEHEIKESYDIVTVVEIMTSPVPALRGIETAGHIERLLNETNCDGFAVVEEDSNDYVGLIRRDQLVVLLECGIYLESVVPDLSDPGRVVTVLRRGKGDGEQLSRDGNSDMFQFRSALSTRFQKKNTMWLHDNVIRSQHGQSVIVGGDESLPDIAVADRGATVVELDVAGFLRVRLRPEERRNQVDIAAAMNRGAYSVMENCPVSKAYMLFTALGLRHLPVLGLGGKVVGMLSRSNFLPSFMQERTNLMIDH